MYYDGAIRKMNNYEAMELVGKQKDVDESVSYSEVVKAAEILYEKFGKPLFITCGERGSLVIDENGVAKIEGLLILSEVDAVGAGDSYLAGAASALAAGYDMKTAGRIGSYVAGVTVQKLFQTGTASPEEILEIRSEEHTSELQSRPHLVCRLLLEKKKTHIMS